MTTETEKAASLAGIVSPGDLAWGLAAVLPHVAAKEVLRSVYEVHELSGVYVRLLGDRDTGTLSKMVLVATDKYTLAEATLFAVPDSANGKEINDSDEVAGVITVTDAKIILATAKRLAKSQSAVSQVEATSQRVMFRFGDAVLTVGWIDASFPKYERLFPAESATTAIEQIVLNANFLGRFGAVEQRQPRQSSAEQGGVRLRFIGESKPVVVSAPQSAVCGFRGLIMPRRS